MRKWFYMNNRDIYILERIIQYCNEINETSNHFGNSYECLINNSIFKNAVSMCILQIDELTTHLSGEFKQKYNDMPWQDIKAMRNIAAHKYGSFDMTKVWETISEDIPELKMYCDRIINETI